MNKKIPPFILFDMNEKDLDISNEEAANYWYHRKDMEEVVEEVKTTIDKKIEQYDNMNHRSDDKIKH